MIFIDIGEVAARAGVRPSALRYYEEIGLISAAVRRGLRRQFPPEVLPQLKLIALAQTAGFSLDEIAGMFGANGLPAPPRDMLHQKADEIDDKIAELIALRETLRHVADCPAPTHMECPTFRRLLDSAGQQPKRRAKRKARIGNKHIPG